jgi:hypothetical protein
MIHWAAVEVMHAYSTPVTATLQEQSGAVQIVFTQRKCY